MCVCVCVCVLDRKHRVVLVKKHKGLFGVSLCISVQDIGFPD